MANPKLSRYYTYVKPVFENKLIRSFAPYIFSLIVTTVMIVFAIRPTALTIVTLLKSLEDNQNTLIGLHNKSESLNTARENWLKIDPADRLKFEAAIPPQPAIPSLVSSIKNIGPTDATIAAIQIQPITIYDAKAEISPQFKISEVDYSFNISGTYAQIYQTLKAINKSTRLLTVDNVILNKSQLGSDLTLSVTGKAYFMK